MNIRIETRIASKDGIFSRLLQQVKLATRTDCVNAADPTL
jgi:hypothetical protein